MQHKKYMQLENLQRLRLMDSESIVSDRIIEAKSAQEKLDNAGKKLSLAENDLNEMMQADRISLDELHIRQSILIQTINELESAEISHETASISEQKSRKIYHRDGQQLEHLLQLKKKAYLRYERKLDDKRMVDVTSGLQVNRKGYL